jgi:hypothetical protein
MKYVTILLLAVTLVVMGCAQEESVPISGKTAADGNPAAPGGQPGSNKGKIPMEVHAPPPKSK